MRVFALDVHLSQLDRTTQPRHVGGDEPALLKDKAGRGGVAQQVKVAVQVAILHAGAAQGKAQFVLLIVNLPTL